MDGMSAMRKLRLQMRSERVEALSGGGERGGEGGDAAFVVCALGMETVEFQLQL